jgi:tripartite-type tricarboxylate transporter receptor subunit TctC
MSVRLQKIGVIGFSLFMIGNLSFSTGVYGAEFPSKAIQIIVPFAPGGPQDIMPRILSKKLSELLGQPIVVVNKPTGAGVIAAQSVLSADPDGHTIFSAEQSAIIIPLITKNIGFTFKDFTPFSVAMKSPMNVIVKKDGPWQTFGQVVAEAKKNPGKLTYSSGGPQAITRFAAELFQIHTGTKITQVPYSGGGGPALTAVLGGHVDMTFVSPGLVKPHYEAGTIRILATMHPKRYKDFPDAPASGEVGYPNLICTIWNAYFVSTKTPQPIIKRLGEVFHEVLKDKEIIAQIDKAGLEPANLDQKEAEKYLAEEEQKWTEAVKAAGLIPK